MRDPPMPERNQVLGRQEADLMIVGQHAVACQRRVVVAIDQHQALTRGDHPRQQCIAMLGIDRRQDDAIHLAIEQHLELWALARRILADVAEQQPVPERMNVLLDRRHDLDEKGMHQVRNDDAERVRPAQREAARDGVGTVTQLFDLREHALTHLVADIAAIVEHLRDSGHRHSKSGGDMSHGDGHRQTGRFAVRGHWRHRLPRIILGPWSGDEE